MSFLDADDKFDDAWHEAILDSFFDEEAENETPRAPLAAGPQK